MTPEEACEYLDISLDEDLTVELLEKSITQNLLSTGTLEGKGQR